MLHFSELSTKKPRTFDLFRWTRRNTSGHVFVTSSWLTWRRHVRWWCHRVTQPSCSVRYVTGGRAKRPAPVFWSLYPPSVSVFWSSVGSCWLASTRWPRATNERSAACPMWPMPVRSGRVTSVPVTRTRPVTRERLVPAFCRRFRVWESTSSTTLGRRNTRDCYTRTVSRQQDSIERFVLTTSR